MARKHILDTVPDARRVTILSEEDGVQRLEYYQDAQPIIEAAKILADQPPGKDFRHAAFIPETELNRAFTEGWFHDKQAWKRWANDPDNSQYRTWPGKL